MILLAVIAFFCSLIISGLLVRWMRLFTCHYEENKPQRFHIGDVPRLGGLSMFISVCVAMLLGRIGVRGEAMFANGYWMYAFLVVMVPAIIAGVAEDVTQSLAVRYRLMLTLMTALLAVSCLNLEVPRLEIAYIDVFWINYPGLGIAVALLAITGLPHAFNIIDGYNGLAGMVAIIVCMALVHVCLQLGDRELAAILLVTAAATAGFLFWNYPSGQLFAGDSGAYVWGVVIALCSIAMVQRHPTVSPWFPMLLLIYPVWETVFSIYRKWVRGVSPGMADALHLHQLIYRRLVRTVLDDDQARRMLRRNNRTAPYLWAFTLFSVVPAVLFWRDTYILMAFCLLFCVTYVTAYLLIIRFKLPSWIR